MNLYKVLIVFDGKGDWVEMVLVCQTETTERDQREWLKQHGQMCYVEIWRHAMVTNMMWITERSGEEIRGGLTPSPCGMNSQEERESFMETDLWRNEKIKQQCQLICSHQRGAIRLSRNITMHYLHPKHIVAEQKGNTNKCINTDNKTFY